MSGGRGLAPVMGPKSVSLSLCLLKTSSAAEILVITAPNADRNKIEISTLYSDEKIPCSSPKIPCSLQKISLLVPPGRSNFVTAWLYQSSRAIGISHIRHDQAIGPDDTRQRIDGLNAVHVYLSKHSPRSETSLRTCGRRLLARRVPAEC